MRFFFNLPICVQQLPVAVVGASLLVAGLAGFSTKQAVGAVTATGDVTPAPPPAGGNVPGPFFVGNSGVGTLLVTLGTPVNVTGSSAIIGDDARGVGNVSLNGFGSNLSTADDVVVGNLGTGSITVQALAKLTMSDDLFVAIENNSTGTLFVDGFGTVVDVNDDVAVGSSGAGLIQITAGGRIFADSTVVGQLAAGEGTVTVSGSNSRWSQSGAMTVGDAGSGILQVVAQARMETTTAILGSAATGVGASTVSGASSTWEITGALTLGLSGQGSLNVLEGGRVTNTGASKIGLNSSSEGYVVVSGANSRWNSGALLTVGDSGFGSLRVLGGGRVVSSSSIIADNAAARGEVAVDGANSLWEISGTLDISEPGEGSLTIANGGLVSTTGVTRIGANGELILSGGRLDVAAVGGVTNQGLIRGGGRINGALTNAAAGEIRVQGNSVLVAGRSLTNSGQMNVSGGEIEVLGAMVNNGDIDVRSGALRFQSTGLDNNTGSQLAVTGGAVDVFGLVDNNLGAQLVVGGGSMAVFHDAVTNNGQLFVMQGSNVLMLENLSFSASSLLGLQLGTADLTDEIGQVEVAGQATLAGALSIELASGYTPQSGDSFQLLKATGGLTGSFSTESLPALGGGLSWDVDYTATSLTLSVTPGLTADFNGDGVVNAADLAKWKTGFGPGGTADADGDGDSDGSDFLAWQREFGSSAAASAGAPSVGAVPEPASTLLVTAALALLPLLRRRSS